MLDIYIKYIEWMYRLNVNQIRSYLEFSEILSSHRFTNTEHVIVLYWDVLNV